MLSYLLVILNILRAVVPVLILLGVAPTFFVFWFLLRLITLLCSSPQLYRRYDDQLYSLYQQFVLFFFENWTGVQVCIDVQAISASTHRASALRSISMAITKRSCREKKTSCTYPIIKAPVGSSFSLFALEIARCSL